MNVQKNGFLILIILFGLLIQGALFAQDASPKSTEEILAEIERIVTQTNWTNQAEADKASQEIKRLTAMIGQSNDDETKTQDSGSSDENSESSLDEENSLNADKLYKMALNAAGQAGPDDIDVDIDMAEPVREEIKKEYEEETKDQITLELRNQPDRLVIDFHQKEAPQMVSKLKTFQAITYLVFINGPHGDHFSTKQLIDAASHLPVENLGFFGFNRPDGDIPDALLTFSNLKVLFWIGNNTTTIPSLASNLPNLQELYLDENPLTQITGSVKGLKHLKKIGIAKTNLSQTEINQLRTSFPNCDILTQ